MLVYCYNLKCLVLFKPKQLTQLYCTRACADKSGRNKRKQTPGGLWTFKNKKTGEEITGVLPLIRGQSNDFAYWCGYGTWQSAKFAKDTRRKYVLGLSQIGALSRMRCLWGTARTNLKGRLPDYKIPNTTPEKMLEDWIAQEGKCAACGGKLPDLFDGLTNTRRKVCFDHDHNTGEPRGFIHHYCNTAEGMITKMSDAERMNFMEWVTRIHNRGNK